MRVRDVAADQVTMFLPRSGPEKSAMGPSSGLEPHPSLDPEEPLPSDDPRNNRTNAERDQPDFPWLIARLLSTARSSDPSVPEVLRATLVAHLSSGARRCGPRQAHS